jgi:type III pantothenate kinase
MLLAFDIGNSTIAVSVFADSSIVAHASVPSTVQRSSAETWKIVTDLLAAHAIGQHRIDGVGISSVVPFLTSAFADLSRNMLGIQPVIIGGTLNLGMRLHYVAPTTLGPDRICSAVAGFVHYGGPLIIVDFGTATTFGAVAANGDFLGGAISFGLKSTAEALSQRTAQLPRVDLQVPDKAICTDTTSAVQAGTMFGALDALAGMIRRMRTELSSDAKVIATGGLSTLMAQHTAIIDAVEPHLVLEGVRLIHARVTAQGKKQEAP